MPKSRISPHPCLRHVGVDPTSTPMKPCALLSVDRGRALSGPGFWSIAGLVIGANVVGLFAAIGPTVDNLSFFWTIAISSSVTSFWLLARYRYVAHIRGWKSLESHFAPVPRKALLLGISLALALVLVVSCGLKGLEWAGISVSKPPRSSMLPGSIEELPIAILFAVLLAPMAEELIFRGLLLDWLRRRIPAWSAAIGLSVCFALLHNNQFKSGAIGWVMLGSRFLLGVAASYLALRYRSLRPSLALHATNNGFAVIAGVLAG